jgi:hypothetical protein
LIRKQIVKRNTASCSGRFGLNTKAVNPTTNPICLDTRMNEAVLGERPFFLCFARMQIGFDETGSLTQRRKPKSVRGAKHLQIHHGLSS